jgi:ribosome-associated protein
MKKIQKKYRDLQAEDMVRIICRVADNQKALDVVALDVRGLSGFADYFVIMGGTSTRHVQGLAGVIDREIASKRSKPADTEGLNEGQWILLDYNDVIVHIFHHEIRAHYDLEGLWHDAPRLDLSQPPPVIEEPAVKKPRKKAVAKAAAPTVAKPAKRAVRRQAAPPAAAVMKPTERVAAQTVKKAAVRPGAKATKSGGKPTGRMSGTPSGKPTGRPSGKPTSKAIKKSTSKPIGKTTGKPTGRPTSKATSRPTSKPAGRTSGKPAGKTTGKVVRKATTPRRGSTGGSKK